MAITLMRSPAKKIPKVIWWPGRLRPYESYTSFLVNFCALNVISPVTFYLYVNDGKSIPSSESVCANIADLISEDISAVKLMMTGYGEIENVTNYGLYGSSDDCRQFFQYCPACIKYGYHSNFHQMVWLRCCPFHFSPLKRVCSSASQFKTFLSLVKQNCGDWPLCEHLDYSLFAAQNNCIAKLLSCWIGNALQEVHKLSDNEIWEERKYEPLMPQHLKYSFGRLCTIEQLPQVLQPFVIEYKRWNLLEISIPPATSREFQDIYPDNHIVEARSKFLKILRTHERSFVWVTKSLAILRSIQKAYSKSCSWLTPDLGCAEDDFLMCLCCPYKVAQNELSSRSGKNESHLASSYFFNHIDWFRCVGDLLVCLNQVAIENALEFRMTSVSPKLFEEYEWLNSMAAQVLNQMVERELGCSYMHFWRRINRQRPYSNFQFFGSIRIAHLEGEIKILKWTCSDFPV